MFFSLIVPTLGRVEELRSLLLSLTQQSLKTFEVIIVDQNEDDRLIPIVEEFSDRLSILHLRSTIRKCNHARNLGASRAGGDIVTFPDDDCVYTKDILKTVNRTFSGVRSPEFITGSVITHEGQTGRSGRWQTEETVIDPHTVWTCLIEFNFFIRRSAFNAVGGFDEMLGPGTPFGSAEGQDLALRLLKKGFAGLYLPTLRIIHPDKPVSLNIARAYSYGAGMGRVMRSNRLAPAIVLMFLLRPIAGGIFYLLKGNIPFFRYYVMTFLGRVRGYLS
ncbi:glycosyltransferase family 2 protein [Gluconacetobacter entanii]|uniref:glycosyltransferase family 2 protein n=1 Tax=Gluconacetobacter entanii TaxID=108528 RepID=UPI00187B1286|nr:glycosyltransferase family A protein [Gluconacetobacter entanii]MBE7619638.1 glycosyltransferase [Komagataeibacter sp. FXV2]MBY4641046.1 glycosyltransferase family 2 protein [Gluconacetobacter entanii]MCW4580242.1 glycosyltransferase family 2 protein [Gluconacetobacter entanii]MCW4583587.1 glycosyltransferase family 2 protein [Gluconacetobacter entanii]MCW4586918.1 glycosyltransferase family 2 protein [Gluconacetobacter entanii]